jgi:tetrahydromethanopterin S-methyltransferase subunit G
MVFVLQADYEEMRTRIDRFDDLAAKFQADKAELEQQLSQVGTWYGCVLAGCR